MIRRLTNRRVSATAMSALLLLAVSCTDMPVPTAPAPADRIQPPTTISRNISPNIDLDQPNLTLQYKNNVGAIIDVTPPWGSLVNVFATDAVRFDHFTSDGWVVVYNQFDVTRTNSRPVMALYNKYRGILRWWWWNDQQPAGPSNYVSYALALDGNNTSALNFTGEFAKDYTVRSYRPFAVKSNNPAYTNGLTKDAWYYFDTEFAYDPQIAGQPQASYSLIVNSWSTSVSKVRLSGDVNGTIQGTISGSGSNASLFGSIIGSLTQTKYENATVVTNSGSEANAPTSLSNKINDAINTSLASAIRSSLNQLATQGLNILASPLSNLFTSILSSGNNPQQKVQLSLAAKLNVTGDITTDATAMNLVGALPGTARGDPSGYLPYYNQTLGLFNLAAPPQVRWHVITGLYPPAEPWQTDIQYFPPVAPTIILNPAIASEVTLSPVTASVIYIEQYSGQETFYNPNYPDSNTLANMSIINSLYGNVWHGFSAPYAIRYNGWTGTPEGNIVLQISFTVTPNNGSPPVDVVKIYRPTFVNY